MKATAMCYEAMTDEELILAYYDCDDEAFEVLWKRHYDHLVPLAYRLLPRMPGQREKAEDFASEGLLKALGTKGRPSARWGPERATVATWLKRIVRYGVIDFLRKCPGRESPLSDVDGRTDQTEQGRLVEILKADDLGPLDRLLEDERSEILIDCLDWLSERRRVVIVLKFWQEISQTEIASVLGVSSATVAREVSDAKADLRRCLKRHLDGVRNRV